MRDVRSGARQLAHQPGFAATAILSLALGIGLNTTLFSVVNSVLFRRGPIAVPERLVEIYSGPNAEFPQLTTSYPDYLDIVQSTDAFSAVAGTGYVRGILSTDQRGVPVTGEVVTPNYFDVLGVRPALGRTFRPSEAESSGEAPVVVLGHGLWLRAFGGRSSVVGENVSLSGRQYEVIGVAPEGFTGTLPGVPTEFWAPVTMVESFAFAGVQWKSDENPGTTRLDRRGTHWLFVKGRLAEGRTVAQARSQVEATFARLRDDYPSTNHDVTASVVSSDEVRFHPMIDGYVKAASAGLFVALGLVLLVACTNVATLLLARGVARRSELALRTALGASRARLIGQLSSEGLVLAAVGGLIGVFIAWWASRALSGFGTDVFPMPIAFDFSVDRTVLGFAVLVSIATVLVFAFLPAWTTSTFELVPVLKGSTESRVRGRIGLKSALIVGQLALCLVLLATGALLFRGLLAAHRADLGFDPRFISSLAFDLQMNGYDIDRAMTIRDRSLSTLKALPGVLAVSTSSRLPLSPDINVARIKVQGFHAWEGEGTVVDVVAVGADYFTVVGVPIVSGRAFSATDVSSGRRVAIVNETMARQFWPDGDCLGGRIFMGGSGSAPYEVIGVARDHEVRSVGEVPRPYLHLPAGPSLAVGLVVRTTMPSEAALPMLRQAVLSLDPNIVFTEDTSATQVAETTMAPTRIAAVMVGMFGALAMALASVGLYGVVAYTVGRRRREIGIRMSLGATRADVLRLVLLQGGRLALAGILLGTAVSAEVGRLLESLLYGVSSFDPVAYGAAAALLLAVTLAANLVPAVTAARTDPQDALRFE